MSSIKHSFWNRCQCTCVLWPDSNRQWTAFCFSSILYSFIIGCFLCLLHSESSEVWVDDGDPAAGFCWICRSFYWSRRCLAAEISLRWRASYFGILGTRVWRSVKSCHSECLHHWWSAAALPWCCRLKGSVRWKWHLSSRWPLGLTVDVTLSNLVIRQLWWFPRTQAWPTGRSRPSNSDVRTSFY